MAAVTTKKPGSDLELQLSFPTVFEDAYAEFGFPQQFAPRVPLVAQPFPAGNDVLDQYHNQKMMDAHRRVMNAVADTRRGTQRALVSHAGFWMMPDAVLSQRIYANPSLGSGAADIYKPLHREAPGLTGGVLRSRPGQEYGQRLLQARIAQLNAIDDAAAGVSEGVPMTDLSISQGIAEVPGPGAFVKLTSLLNNLNNALGAGVGALTRFEGTDFNELMLLLFRVAPQANREELENILEALDLASESAREALQDLQEVRPDEDAPGAAAPVIIYRTRKVRGANQYNVIDGAGRVIQGPFDTDAEAQAVADEMNRRGIPLRDRQFQNNWAETIATSVPLLREYVAIQFRAVNKTPQERIALSRNAIRSLGLTKWRKSIETRKDAADAFARYAQSGRQGPVEVGAPAPEEPMTVGFGRRRGGAASMQAMTPFFTQPTLAREDAEQLGNRARFNRDQRQVFGDNAGRWYGQEYENTEPSGTAVGRVANAAAMGIRNPFRAPGAAADERGDREFEQAAVRAAPMPSMGLSVAEQRQARMAAQAQAQQAARMAAQSSMDQAIGKGKRRSIQSIVKVLTKGMPKRKGGRKGGMDNEPPLPPLRRRLDAIGHEDEDEAIPPPPTPAEPPTRRSPPKPRKDRPAKTALKPPARGEGKLKLVNQAGKAHRGPYHQMEDGTYHSGAKHTKRSKPLTIAK